MQMQTLVKTKCQKFVLSVLIGNHYLQKKLMDELTGGPGRPCRPVNPLCPFCPLSPASPASPLSPRGPCGP